MLKKIQDNKLTLLVISFIATILSLFLITSTAAYFKKTEVKNLTTNQTFDINEIRLDYEGKDEEEILFTGNLYIPSIHQKTYKIYIDDCLVEMKLDGEIMDLAKYFETNEPCYSKVEMPTFLVKDISSGEHNVEFRVKNKSGGIAFYMETKRTDTLYSLFFALVCISSLFFLIVLGLFIIERKSLLISVIIFTLLAFGYLSVTTWHDRTHDVHGHLAFFQILQNGKYPGPQDCWECHQQPLYYLTSSAIESAFKFVGINGFNQHNFILQVVNLIFFGIFLLFGIGILEIIFKQIQLSQATSFILTLLFSIWPSGILHSIRIGNDSLLYMLAAGSIYFLYKWIQKTDWKLFVYACVVGCFAILTKVSAILLIPVFMLAVIQKEDIFGKIRAKISERTSLTISDLLQMIDAKIFRTLVIVIIVVIILAFGPTLIMTQGKELTHMNEPGNPNFKMEQDLKYFIFFDIKEYLTTPTFHTWDDCCGRNNFWVAIPKSSLFGEFGMGNETNKLIFSKIINLISFLVLIITAINLFKIIKSKPLLTIYFPIFAFGLFLLLSVIYFRWKYPYYSNQDFRYMYPFLIPWIAVLGIQENKYKIAIYISMIIAVTVFFLNVIVSNKY